MHFSNAIIRETGLLDAIFGATSLIPEIETKKKYREFADQAVSTDGYVVMTKRLDNSIFS